MKSKNEKKNILIEGWRGINHSYAMVNQYQLLELANRGDVNVFHRDLPFFKSEWNTVNNSNGLDSDKNKIINSLKNITNEKVDITYRITFPFRLYGGHSDKIFAFGTAEFQTLDGYLYQGPENSENHVNKKVFIITPSYWSREGFLRNGFKAEEVVVVPHGVDTNIFKPLDNTQRILNRNALKLNDQHFMFLNVGAMTWNKGIDILLLAFAQINKKYPDTRLVLKDQSNLYGIGALDILADMKKNHPSLFTDSIFSRIGVLSNNFTLNQLKALYNTSDAYISPYRAEGFNMPPLEAAACGVPVALTSGGASDDYFNDSFALKIDGFKKTDGNRHFIEPDTDSLIGIMSDLIEHRTPHINRFQALHYINEKFSWKTVINRLLEIF